LAVPQILRTQKASLFAAVPGVYRKLLQTASGDHDVLNFPDLRHALSAGEKLSERISDAWLQKTSTQIYEAFGMSECSTFISHAPNRAADATDKGTLGRPQTGRRVAIVDDTGPVARGAVGQIAVHKSDPGLMMGYVNAPDATAERFQGDWFLTGDLGRMSDTGSIHYEGRADDMMNAGGFRVSPLEVETALASLPGVLQVGVTDVEIKADTRIIIAFLVLSDGVTPQDVERFANQSLARYKQPKDYLQITALPVNANGKLNRNALRAAYKASIDGSDQT
jgi:acyl-coenzyme A synthetase/AMP-(fatty) acid ligase